MLPVLFAQVCQPLQERGIRSGTVPSSLVVGLGEACRIAEQGPTLFNILKS
jgi:cysteine sulfinate desulfinase/cysteine desulfurase-like protein